MPARQGFHVLLPCLFAAAHSTRLRRKAFPHALNTWRPNPHPRLLQQHFEIGGDKKTKGAY
jgi:hypothetical protein